MFKSWFRCAKLPTPIVAPSLPDDAVAKDVPYFFTINVAEYYMYSYGGFGQGPSKEQWDDAAKMGIRYVY